MIIPKFIQVVFFAFFLVPSDSVKVVKPLELERQLLEAKMNNLDRALDSMNRVILRKNNAPKTIHIIVRKHPITGKKVKKLV